MHASRLSAVINSQTAGHPTPVIAAGIPPLRGQGVREHRGDFRSRNDGLRAPSLHEPRRHAGMAAAVPLPSRVADPRLYFVSSHSYADMCGHATIGYIASLAAVCALPASFEQNGMSIETPAGIFHVNGAFEAGRLSAVVLRSLPYYVPAADVAVEREGVGTVSYDISCSGITYPLVDDDKVDLPFDIMHASRWCRTGMAIKEAINAAGGHPLVDSVLSYRAIKGGARHLVVLADNKFARSPCGIGTSTRLTQPHGRGKLAKGPSYQAENILGVPFAAKILDLGQSKDGRHNPGGARHGPRQRVFGRLGRRRPDSHRFPGQLTERAMKFDPSIVLNDWAIRRSPMSMNRSDSRLVQFSFE
ncbi:proline racemase family protein [Mesorhizobium sp. M1169]